MDLSAKIGIATVTLLVLGGTLLSGEDTQELQSVVLPPPVLNEVVTVENADTESAAELEVSTEVGAEDVAEVLPENIIQSVREELAVPTPSTQNQL